MLDTYPLSSRDLLVPVQYCFVHSVVCITCDSVNQLVSSKLVYNPLPSLLYDVYASQRFAFLYACDFTDCPLLEITQIIAKMIIIIRQSFVPYSSLSLCLYVAVLGRHRLLDDSLFL